MAGPLPLSGKPATRNEVAHARWADKILHVGGATLVSSLVNEGLIDELRVTIHPLILGGGKALFKDVNRRVPLQLVRTRPFGTGKILLTYRTRT